LDRAKKQPRAGAQVANHVVWPNVRFREVVQLSELGEVAKAWSWKLYGDPLLPEAR
jgi:hypothetical protein